MHEWACVYACMCMYVRVCVREYVYTQDCACRQVGACMGMCAVSVRQQKHSEVGDFWVELDHPPCHPTWGGISCCARWPSDCDGRWRGHKGREAHEATMPPETQTLKRAVVLPETHRRSQDIPARFNFYLTKESKHLLLQVVYHRVGEVCC